MSRFKLGAPDGRCKGVTVEGVTYRPQADGLMHVENPRHARMMREGGECFNAVNAPVGGRAWVCECGFRAVFNHCGRCGREDLTREDA